MDTLDTTGNLGGTGSNLGADRDLQMQDDNIARSNSSLQAGATGNEPLVPGNEMTGTAGFARTAAEKLHYAAGKIRANGDLQSNSLTARFGDRAATAFDRTADYVEGSSASTLRRDLSGMIQRRPLQALAIGLGAGALLARLFR